MESVYEAIQKTKQRRDRHIISPRASAAAAVMVHKSDHKSEITGVENDRERKLEMNSFDFR